MPESGKILTHLLEELAGMTFRFRMDPFRSFIFFGPDGVALTGYPSGKLVESGGVNYSDLIYPGDRSHLSRVIQEALKENRIYEIAYRIKSKKGEEKKVLELGHKVETKGESCLVEGIIVDISRLTRKELPGFSTPTESGEIGDPGPAGQSKVVPEAAAEAASYREPNTLTEERDRLARELHDTVTQSLYSLTLFAEAAKRLTVQGNSELALSHLEHVKRTSRQALKEIRLLIYEARSEEERQSGLEERIRKRLESVERRSGVDFVVEIDPDLDLTGPEEENLYSLIQEALNNAHKHAEAQKVEVKLNSHNGNIRLEVIDDGKGFDPSSVQKSGGQGVRNMQERAEEIGGFFEINSLPGKGTTIVVELER